MTRKKTLKTFEAEPRSGNGHHDRRETPRTGDGARSVGRLTIDRGAQHLKDKINSLIAQDRTRSS